MIAVGATLGLEFYPMLAAPKEDPLLSREEVDDETAKLALRNFFEAVLQSDGPVELRRLHEAFYRKFHGVPPPGPADWSDKEPDGNRKVSPPGAKAAGNGK